MKTISSRETLDFLSKSAPRAWVKKMLLWMISSGELTAFAEAGRSVEATPAYPLIWKAAGTDTNGDEKNRLIREAFSHELAEKLIKSKELDKIEQVTSEWQAGGEARTIAAGFFVYAQSIDWDEGSLYAEIDQHILEDKWLFREDDDLLQGEFEDAQYRVALSGICFERDTIEMLQPHVDITSAPSKTVAAAPAIGRPRIWDWDGATTYLLTIAQTPDGLPTGPGAQAQIERLLADWFARDAGKAPADSLVRKHATKIMRALNKPESQ